MRNRQTHKNHGKTKFWMCRYDSNVKNCPRLWGCHSEEDRGKHRESLNTDRQALGRVRACFFGQPGLSPLCPLGSAMWLLLTTFIGPTCFLKHNFLPLLHHCLLMDLQKSKQYDRNSNQEAERPVTGACAGTHLFGANMLQLIKENLLFQIFCSST